MKRWTTVMACALTLGLMSAPISVYADHHEGGEAAAEGSEEMAAEGSEEAASSEEAAPEASEGGDGACGGDGMGKSEGSH